MSTKAKQKKRQVFAKKKTKKKRKLSTESEESGVGVAGRALCPKNAVFCLDTVPVEDSSNEKKQEVGDLHLDAVVENDVKGAGEDD